MTIYVYKQGYEEPEPTVPYMLTAPQRLVVKTGMQTRVTNQSKVLIGELVRYAEDYILTNYGKHVDTAQLAAIALEIREEWGYPGQGEEP